MGIRRLQLADLVPTHKGVNVPYDLYDADPEGFDVFSWSPTPQEEVNAGKPQAPSTQVHLFIHTMIGKVVVRFKGPNTLDALIGALIKHRVDVFGPPNDHSVWMRK